MLSENQIERRVEKMMDALDRQLMAGVLDQKSYDSAVKDLGRWAEFKYSERRSADRVDGFDRDDLGESHD